MAEGMEMPSQDLRHGRKAARGSSRAMARRPTLPPPRAGMLQKAGRLRRVRPGRSPGPGDPTASARPTACRATSAPQRTSSPDGVRPGPRPSRSTGGVSCAGGNRQSSSQARSRSMRGRATRASAVPGPTVGASTIRANPSPGARVPQSSANWSTPSATRSPIASLRPRRGPPEHGLGDVDGGCADANAAPIDEHRAADRRDRTAELLPSFSRDDRIERPAADARIAEAEEVAVRLEVQAASRRRRRPAPCAMTRREALGMRTPHLDAEWRHRTHCTASAAAAAFDGATMMPASASLRTCARSHLRVGVRAGH